VVTRAIWQIGPALSSARHVRGDRQAATAAVVAGREGGAGGSLALKVGDPGTAAAAGAAASHVRLSRGEILQNCGMPLTRVASLEVPPRR